VTFPELLETFARAVESGDGTALAALFAEDGVYDDVFYGAFQGRRAIAAMLEGLFHRDGKDFRWEFSSPVREGSRGYADWLFSYTSTTKHCAGRRIIFDGVSVFDMADGLIARYRDVCNGCVPLAQMGTPATVMDSMIAKWQRSLEASEGYPRHAAGLP